ncbi:hypothetical protein B0H13DRAFT_2648934 [Mycena leptocephala]|nr:hypothetical protein B0H13DRAFT_2648934 [Mycena leptocephala]
MILREVGDIVEKDTGCTIQWRHLHAESAAETPGRMVLQWTGDQHGGQAKGIGLHLQELAQAMPYKYDLHEPGRLLESLGPYDHLRRNFRLCTVHAKRNLKACAVGEPVRNLMRSLFCMRHTSWDETIFNIQTQGGKAGFDWVQDKLRSKFAFPALCWEKSFIPEDVWKAGEAHSNLIESVHADVNREGIRCTLVGGLKKGQAFDKMKMKTLALFEDFNIRPSYRSGHLSENAIKGLKRKSEIWETTDSLTLPFPKCLPNRPHTMHMASHRYFGVAAAQTGYFDGRVAKRGRRTTVAATGVKCVRFLIKGSIVAVATVMSDPQEKSITGVQNGAAESVGFETAPVPDVTPTLDTATAIDVEGNPQVNDIPNTHNRNPVAGSTTSTSMIDAHNPKLMRVFVKNLPKNFDKEKLEDEFLKCNISIVKAFVRFAWDKSCRLAEVLVDDTNYTKALGMNGSVISGKTIQVEPFKSKPRISRIHAIQAEFCFAFKQFKAEYISHFGNSILFSDLHLALRLREEYTHADPFAPDVWWMGNLIQRNLIERHSGLGFQPLVNEMRCEEPDCRPTIGSAVIKFDALILSVLPRMSEADIVAPLARDAEHQSG